ncbi:MAG: hypothetical protein H7222_11105 [Methylotenera sp.]|nr:hypothetical protein [Oligoflexia bacterium]
MMSKFLKRETVFGSVLISSALVITSLAQSAQASTMDHFSGGCATTAGAAGEAGAVTLLKVKNVSVNVYGGVSIRGESGVFAIGSHSYRRERSGPGKAIILTFKFNHADPTSKAVAQECINNARIAMASGMSLAVDGNFAFKVPSGNDAYLASTQCNMSGVVDGTGHDLNSCMALVAGSDPSVNGATVPADY